MSGCYKPFRDVTRDALRFAAERMALSMQPGQEVRLMNQYASLSAFPENLSAPRALKAAGLPLGILGNGNREMIEVSVRSAGMTGLFDQLLDQSRGRAARAARHATRLHGQSADRRAFRGTTLSAAPMPTPTTRPDIHDPRNPTESIQ